MATPSSWCRELLLMLCCSVDFKSCLTFTPRSLLIKGVQTVSLRAECHSEFILGDGNMLHEACEPVLGRSVPFCVKELFFFFSFLKQTYITESFLPHPPLTRHAIGTKGVTQVEQDGFTSANAGNNTTHMRLICLQHMQTR